MPNLKNNAGVPRVLMVDDEPKKTPHVRGISSPNLG